MRIFNLIDTLYTPKRRVGVWLGTPAYNLLYENRNGTGLQSFLQKNNFKNFSLLSSISNSLIFITISPLSVLIRTVFGLILLMNDNYFYKKLLNTFRNIKNVYI